MEIFTTYSELDTINLGEKFAKNKLIPGDVIALFGDLGAGKTRFIQGICKGFGITEHVSSPSFTIVNEYTTGKIKIYHFDFYRVKTMNEVIDIGFDEYIYSNGICLIEWADRIRDILPPNRYEINLLLGDSENIREIKICKLD